MEVNPRWSRLTGAAPSVPLCSSTVLLQDLLLYSLGGQARHEMKDHLVLNVCFASRKKLTTQTDAFLLLL